MLKLISFFIVQLVQLREHCPACITDFATEVVISVTQASNALTVLGMRGTLVVQQMIQYQHTAGYRLQTFVLKFLHIGLQLLSSFI